MKLFLWLHTSSNTSGRQKRFGFKKSKPNHKKNPKKLGETGVRDPKKQTTEQKKPQQQKNRKKT